MPWIIDDRIQGSGNNAGHHLFWRDSISEEEFHRFLNDTQFIRSFGEIRDSITICRNNGDELKRYLSSDNLNQLYTVESVHPKQMLREANRLCFNFAASFRTAIEIIERVAGEWDDACQLEELKLSSSDLFDSLFSYRFWYKVRNYIVHNKGIYTRFSSDGTETHISASCKELASWKNWSPLQREEIERFGEESDYRSTIYPAVSSLYIYSSLYAEHYEKQFAISKNAVENYIERYDIQGELLISENEKLEEGPLKYYEVACWEFDNIGLYFSFSKKFIKQLADSYSGIDTTQSNDGQEQGPAFP
jgi:hypothetical protein